MPRSTGGSLENRVVERLETRRGRRLARADRQLSERAGSVALAVEVRRLAYVDLPQVIAIERRSFPAPWSLAMFVLELSKPTSVCLGAVHQGELIGYLICSRYHTVWHVMNVAVDVPCRRLGVATTLIERLLAETSEESDRYTLEVRVSNKEAIRMYEHFGFRGAGVRRRYYHDNNEDALIMWRTSRAESGRTTRTI
jgi:[ribosomal protein S18]-alanine N-acetyltransferase